MIFVKFACDEVVTGPDAAITVQIERRIGHKGLLPCGKQLSPGFYFAICLGCSVITPPAGYSLVLLQNIGFQHTVFVHELPVQSGWLMHLSVKFGLCDSLGRHLL